MNLKYVPFADIDKQKWDLCIENATNTTIYAYAWYLDEICPHWDALVLNDYTGVMPLPWTQKYGLKVIYQPFFAQQLGVFSALPLSQKILHDFLKAIPLKFIKITTNLNVANATLLANVLQLRNNYVLDLNKPYQDLHAKYAKDIKNTLRKPARNLKKDLKIDQVVNFYVQHYASRHSNISEKDYTTLKKLLHKIASTPGCTLEIIGINEDNNLVAFDTMTLYKKKLYYQLCGANSQGKKIDAHYILIDNMIEKYALKADILDFEGSEIASIAYFFKKFGATPQQYGVYQTTIFKRIIQTCKNIFTN